MLLSQRKMSPYWIHRRQRGIVLKTDPKSQLSVSVQIWHRSLRFLSNDDTLKEYESNLGYDTCRKTKGYDASPCIKDCQRLEKSDFAKKCAEDGGLFKCCIRFKRNAINYKKRHSRLGEMQNIVMNADFAAHFLSAQILPESQSFYLQMTH